MTLVQCFPDVIMVGFLLSQSGCIQYCSSYFQIQVYGTDLFPIRSFTEAPPRILQAGTFSAARTIAILYIILLKKPQPFIMCKKLEKHVEKAFRKSSLLTIHNFCWPERFFFFLVVVVFCFLSLFQVYLYCDRNLLCGCWI